MTNFTKIEPPTLIDWYFFTRCMYTESIYIVCACMHVYVSMNFVNFVEIIYR